MKKKIIILTGFLGSGKTTLLRGVISRIGDRSKVLAIINELGEASLDHNLVRVLSENVRFLRGGCACCNIREDLVNALREMLSLEMRGEAPPPEYVVIETSGVSDPAPISFTITTDPVLQHHYKIHKIVATVSTVNGERVLEMSSESLKQLMMADLIVLTKVDMTPKSENLVMRIRSLNPVAEIVESAKGEMDPAIFFSSAGYPAATQSGFTGPELGRSEVLTIVFEGEVDWAVFGIWLSALLYAHGEKIIRVKAAVNVGGGDFVLINGVQHIIHSPEHFRANPDDKSRLMIISRGVDPGRILDSFQAFQSGLGGLGRLEYVVTRGAVHG
ncbi:MAG: GTP-binding protein [Nitrososphaerota archaeon]